MLRLYRLIDTGRIINSAHKNMLLPLPWQFLLMQLTTKTDFKTGPARFPSTEQQVSQLTLADQGTIHFHG